MMTTPKFLFGAALSLALSACGPKQSSQPPVEQGNQSLTRMNAIEGEMAEKHGFNLATDHRREHAAIACRDRTETARMMALLTEYQHKGAEVLQLSTNRGVRLNGRPEIERRLALVNANLTSLREHQHAVETGATPACRPDERVSERAPEPLPGMGPRVESPPHLPPNNRNRT